MTTAPVPILLVDDQPANLQALTALLEAGCPGLQIVQATSGEEALRHLLTHDFGLILMDVLMPDMNGFETAVKIRSNPQTRYVPIIFITAQGVVPNFEFLGYESGAVDYLLKPLEEAPLYAKVQVFAKLYRQRQALADHERYLAHMAKLVTERASISQERDKPMRVLLVDDKPENLLALEAQLADMEDIVIVKANSGPAALRAVLRDDFAVILLDVHMPGMDGYETAELIHGSSKSRMIPIIFITAGGVKNDAIAMGYRQGVVDFLIHPVETAIVRSKIRVFCDLYRQRIAMEQHNTYLETLVADRTKELRKHASELMDSRENYRQVAETLELATRAANLGIWDWNIASNQITWDARMCELYGLTQTKHCPTYDQWLAQIHPDDVRRFDESVQRAMHDGLPQDIEFRILLPDNTERNVKANGQVLFDTHRQPLRMTGVNYDITERNRSALEIQRHRDHLLELVNERTAELSAIVDYAADGIITADQHGNILTFNAAAEGIFGYSATHVIGKNIQMLLSHSERESLEALFRATTDNNTQHFAKIVREAQGQHENGNCFPIYIAISEFLVDGERRFTGIVRDISEQKALEAKLIEAREVAEAAHQAKMEYVSRLARSNAELEQFAYVASHDLQEPLRMVTSYLQLLEQRYGDRLDGDATEFIAFAVDGAMRMQSLIRDLLAYSRLDAKIFPDKVVDCKTAVDSALRALSKSIDESEAKINCGSLPKVRGDEIQISQLFQNLIINAIKFRSERTPEIQITAEADQQYWRFSVQDNGIGIAPEYFERVFVMFQRLHSRTQYPGTGIGLALCKKIVECHGGKIWVSSSSEAGTIFQFTLPSLEGGVE